MLEELKSIDTSPLDGVMVDAGVIASELRQAMVDCGKDPTVCPYERAVTTTMQRTYAHALGVISDAAMLSLRWQRLGGEVQ